MTADWTVCRVVRDRDGDLWGRLGDDWVSLLPGATDSFPSDWLMCALGPLVPVLDADGLPVVATVGDLAARHIGRRVRLWPGTIDELVVTIARVRHIRAGTNVADDTGYPPLDTPCEVLS